MKSPIDKPSCFLQPDLLFETQCQIMPQGDINKNAEFSTQNGCKGHQRSNLEWHYIKKLISPGVLFVWKILYLYQKQHRVGTMPLH